MDSRSELTSAAAPHTPRDFHWESAFESNRTGPTDAGCVIETDHAGLHTRIGLWVDCAA
jgi:hypothetical protein